MTPATQMAPFIHTSQVDDVLLWHSADADILVIYRGMIGTGSNPKCVVFNPQSGLQSAVSPKQLAHTSLTLAVQAAKQAGFNEVLDKGCWYTFEAWLRSLPRSAHERHYEFVMTGAATAIEELLPSSNVRRVLHVRDAKDDPRDLDLDDSL